MYLKAVSFIAILLILCLLVGCEAQKAPAENSDPISHSEPTPPPATEAPTEAPTELPTEPHTEAATEPPTEPPTEPAAFVPYLLKIQASSLPIYSGPGYDYIYRRSIEDRGTYTIVEEALQYFSNGRYVTWGKLKSGAGWICIEDAQIDAYDFFRCTQCGRTDVAPAYHGFGKCENCDTVDPAFICKGCGANCFFRGLDDNGMCEDCNAKTATTPVAACQNCGITSAPLNNDGLCENCAAGKCTECGGPLDADHNCDDYPNVFCPNCDWSMHTTGVGLDGFTCPDCGTHFMP